jgi:hypothetical protein
VFGAVAIACSAIGYLLAHGGPGASSRPAEERGASRRGDPARFAATRSIAEKIAEPPAAILPLFDSHARFTPGETVALRFRALDGSGSPAASEVLSVSVTRTPGGAEARLVAREIGGGIYEVPFTPDGTGSFQLVVGADGAARPLAAVKLQVGGEAAPPGASASSQEPGSDVEQTGDEERRLRTFLLIRRGGRR